ncbi:MAG TPA: amino acid adenylation domain-containing protein, partial [Pyrinomonadaceae bacterium]|nr:amino acid adenylation domain-containing protein [Pyrinomonadaceae bacterium]
ALLGIIKAGAAYVPLDPSAPRDRQTFMILDSGAELLITSSKLRQSLPETAALVISLDEEAEAISRQSDQNVASSVTPENLVYVIYTSGSTGTPKGVAVEHRELALRIVSMSREYRLEPGQRLLQFVALSFDAFAEEIFPSLIAGATLCIHSNPTQLAAEQFVSLCEQMAITVLHLPAAYWIYLTENVSRHSRLNEIRLCIVGGESITAGQARDWFGLVGDTSTLSHVYGPTETTITAITKDLVNSTLTLDQAARIPIGRPLPQTEVFLLDRYSQLAPIGSEAELYIGGAGVARGYLGRAELTAERFVPNPFSHEAGARLYRTGDVVRYLADGNLEYLGRADQQVKIRGYRIELGEIEAVLSEHASVSQAVVVARATANGEQQLVAYVVPQGESDSSEWREYLQQRLPDYMVPTVFVSLPALPLTTNGKVDRRALPEPETVASVVEIARTPTEELLCGIWSEVLGRAEIGV